MLHASLHVEVNLIYIHSHPHTFLFNLYTHPPTHAYDQSHQGHLSSNKGQHASLGQPTYKGQHQYQSHKINFYCMLFLSKTITSTHFFLKVSTHLYNYYLLSLRINEKIIIFYICLGIESLFLGNFKIKF